MGDVFASWDAAQRFLEPHEIGPMPRREQHIAMVAVPAPVAGVAPSGAAKRLAVEPADPEEGIVVIRRQRLDAAPRSHQILERLRLVVMIVVLQIFDGPANPSIVPSYSPPMKSSWTESPFFRLAKRGSPNVRKARHRRIARFQMLRGDQNATNNLSVRACLSTHDR